MPDRLPDLVVRRNVLITAALGPLFLIPGFYTAPALLLLIALQIVVARRSKPTPANKYVGAAMVAMVVALGIGLWASPNRDLSWPAFYRMSWSLALFWAIAHGPITRPARRALSLILMILAATLAVLSLFGTGWFAGKLLNLPIYDYLPTLISDATSGVSGAFHPNVIAATLGPLMLFASALSLEVTLALRWKLMLWALVLLLGVIILMTQSRGGWIAVAIGFMVLSFVALKGRPAQGALAVGCTVIIAGLVWSWMQAGSSPSQTTSFASRSELWERSLLMLRDMPFTGIGLAAFPAVMDAFYPSFIAGPDANIPHAHNLYLQAALDLGVFGMLAFLALLAGALVVAWQGAQRAPRFSFEWCFAIAATTALIVIGFHGLIDAGIWPARSSPLMWALMGVGLSIGMGQSPARLRDQSC